MQNGMDPRQPNIYDNFPYGGYANYVGNTQADSRVFFGHPFFSPFFGFPFFSPFFGFPFFSPFFGFGGGFGGGFGHEGSFHGGFHNTPESHE